MEDSKRTKLLAGALGLVVVFWLFEPHKAILKPLNDADLALSNAEADLEEAEDAKLNMLKAKRNMRLWKKQSLPPDDRNGQRVYQQWIQDLAEESGLSSVKVEAGSRPKKRSKAVKDDIYVAAQLKITAEGTLTELSRFLYRFKRTALLHRVVTLSVQSDDIEGDPILEIGMLAEAISMTSAAPRLKLFQETWLSEAIEDDSTTLQVADLEMFPKEPGFQLQVDSEYMIVTAVDEETKTLTVQRAADDSTANSHDAKARVEWIPVAEEMKDVTFDEYKEFLAASPFVKPEPERQYEPAIQVIAKKSVKPGEKLDFRVKTEGFNPVNGGPVFKLAEGHPEGMTINEKTGAVEWQTADDTKIETYKATVQVTQSDDATVDLSKEFSVEVAVANNAPSIGVPDGRITAWLGQPLTVELDVKDETPSSRLKFSVIGADGAYIDSETNAFKWNPDQTLEPGDYTATIKVTDREGKESEARINIIARDDEARYTKIIGSASIVPEKGEQEEQAVAWMYSTISNKTTKLQVGTEFSVADIVGTVKSIDPRSVTIETKDGQMELALGRDLRTGAKKLEAAKQSPAESSTEEDASTNEDQSAGATPTTGETNAPSTQVEEPAREEGASPASSESTTTEAAGE